MRYNSRNYWGWLENSEYKDEIEVVMGDIRDYDAVSSATKGCNSIFHLAALIGIPYSYVSPLAYIRTNIEGTYNILQSARETNAENVVVTSTSETYGTAQYVPIDENQSCPLLIIDATFAKVSTLFITVGFSHKPETTGYGGLGFGIPRFPSIEAINAVSSPQTKAPAPFLIFKSKLKSLFKIFLPSKPYCLH